VWIQREIDLRARARGCHLITSEVLAALPEIEGVSVGVLMLLLAHTSASLTLNENASPEVRADLNTWLDAAVPERSIPWTHTLEGSDDMPAHVKSSLMGPSLTLPLGRGRVILGTWQGIYLCEHRNHGGARRLIATLWGE
jgi:secondary thiamine-phosphate synthase enzyme